MSDLSALSESELLDLLREIAEEIEIRPDYSKCKKCEEYRKENGS